MLPSIPTTASCPNHAVKRFAANTPIFQDGQVSTFLPQIAVFGTSDGIYHSNALYSSFPATNPANWANTVFVAPRDATADINAVAAKFGAAGTVVGINAATPTNS